MSRNKITGLVIMIVTFFIPFKFGILDIELKHPVVALIGFLFTIIGFITGFVILNKDEAPEHH